MLNKLISYIFPPKCVFCGNILNEDSDICICKGCFCKLCFLDINSCEYKSIFNTKWCDKIICACQYEGILKSALIKFKFSNKPSFYRALAYIVGVQIENLMITEKIDMLIAVPLSKKRTRERGYNQAFLIGVYISKIFKITNASSVLRRIKETKAQSTLKRQNRQQNIIGAFVLEDPRFVEGKNILILDDIFTTGSTVDECAKVLKDAGANKVFSAVVASTRKF